MTNKEKVESALIKKMKALSVDKTGYWKYKKVYNKWVKTNFINTYYPSLMEYGVAISMNSLRDPGDSYMPTDLIKDKEIRKARQFDGWDVCRYRWRDDAQALINLKGDVSWTIDVKSQPRARKMGTVNLEVYTIDGEGYKKDSWAFNEKVDSYAFVLENDFYLIGKDAVIAYAKTHLDEAVENGFEAQSQDEGYSHVKKFNVLMPVSYLEQHSFSQFKMRPEVLEVLKKKFNKFMDHSHYSEETFKWLDKAIEDSKSYYQTK